MRIVRHQLLTRNRLYKFIAAYFGLLEGSPSRAPTPTQLNRRMGRKPIASLDGRDTRWRTFLLLETGFVRDPRSKRWKRPEELP